MATMRPLSVISFALLSTLIFVSCAIPGDRAAILWTDRSEFAAYAEQFNASQPHYKVEVYYKANPADALLKTRSYPDILIGSWLKNSGARRLYRPLDYFFEDLLIQERAFYPKLLALGNIDNRQYLLPVSFNVPAMVFSRENSSMVTNPFTLNLEEIKTLAKGFNQKTDGAYIRMGFSPRWDDDFLFTMTSLFDVGFREGNPLNWDESALEESLRYIADWSTSVNTDVASEDDFAFKYLYDPPAKLALSGRLLFAYITSQKLFTVSEERRSTLDFRWVERKSRIPVSEGAPYLALCKKGRSRTAADAFVKWFYTQETQRKLLETSKQYRLNESVFGIAGGFSSLKAVNEQIFPQFYPGLLGHVPPAEYISPPNILPKNWTQLKTRVILPYLRDRARAIDKKTNSLSQRLTDWLRQNPIK